MVKKVKVIGAGIAGMSVASYLQKFLSFMVFLVDFALHGEKKTMFLTAAFTG